MTMHNEDYINEEKPQQFFMIIELEFAPDYEKIVKEILNESFYVRLLPLSGKDRIEMIKEATDADGRVSEILERIGITSINHLEQPKTETACHFALDFEFEVAGKILFAINSYLIARRDFRKALNEIL